MKVGYARISTIKRTLASLTAAKARGRKGGRNEKLTAKQVETLRKMADSRQHSVAEICRVLSISKPTYYRYLRINHDR